MDDDDHFCGFDMDGLCGEEPIPKIEGEERTSRDRAIEASESIDDLEKQRRSRSRSRSRERKAKDKTRDRSRSKEPAPKKEEPAKKKSSALNLPFIKMSPSGENQKSKTKTQKVEASKEKREVDTESESDGSQKDRSNEREILANVFMISGCEDKQTSADVSNVSNFSLPNPNGRAGGACTSALLKVLYSGKNDSDLTFVQVLGRMRRILRKGRYSQTPQLTSSQQIDISNKFYIVPPNCTGTKRAVLIGINYVGQDGELSGCHNDCLNMKNYIMNVWGFEEKNITVLMDDGYHQRPTRRNIINAYQDVAYASQSGDVVFCHYSGHGGRVRDDDFDEADGYDETLVPVDYETQGQIRDDDLYSNLVCAMDSGVTLCAVMDCCHSGTVLDLPYKYRPTVAGDLQLDPWSLDGGNALITVCLLAVIIIFVAIIMPIYFFS